MLCVYVCFILSSICVLYTMKSFLIFFFLFSRLNKIANYSAFASHSNVFFRHVKFGTNLQLNRNTTKLVTTTPYPLGITGSFQCWTECNFLKYSIFSKFVFLVLFLYLKMFRVTVQTMRIIIIMVVVGQQKCVSKMCFFKFKCLEYENVMKTGKEYIG